MNNYFSVIGEKTKNKNRTKQFVPLFPICFEIGVIECLYESNGLGQSKKKKKRFEMDSNQKYRKLLLEAKTQIFRLCI